MNCKNCQIELEQSKTKPRVFCSDRCTKAYNRRLENGQITDKVKTDITEQTKTDNTNFINRWGKNVGEMDAGTLYAYIGAYQNDTWKDSPEYRELMKRLKSKPLKALRTEGYWIPSWKDPQRV